MFITTLMVPDNKEAAFDAELWLGGVPPRFPGGVGINTMRVTLRISLRFEEGQGDVTWNFDNNNMNFVFRGWKNPLGNALKTPLKAGTLSKGIEKIPFGFLVASYYLETINIVTLQIVTGGTYEPI